MCKTNTKTTALSFELCELEIMFVYIMCTALTEQSFSG